jgi:N-acetylglucosaminyldiphosphoundecaprenol N-acetyl-beta-D-mannosaminyltransferase
MNESVSRKINIAGTGISDVSLEETLGLFSNWIDNGEKKRICVTPVNCVVWAHRSTGLRQIYNEADLTLCDGVPLLWAARFIGARLKGRVTGLDLLPAFSATAARKGYRMFLLGARPGVGDSLAEQLTRLYPGIQICGTYAPPMMQTFTAEENEKMIRIVNAAAPDILWVSFTAPKQDFWINEHFHLLETKVVVGVGGAFEVTAGLIDRAPRWMQHAGAEWLYRLLKEPKRLWRRYLLEAPQILPMLLKQRIRKV